MFKEKKTKVHFIGIGGIGMSGIAEILLNLGYPVTGSDVVEGAQVEKLKQLGAKIFIGHKRENILDAGVVVYSSAINKMNPEFIEAKKKKIPLIRRAEMLAELMRLKYGIAIAGTHGKTTTTSMVATILHECGIDPTHVIGGVVNNLGGHAKLGNGKFIVAEADESDGSFLLLTPVLSVITNIDNDHMDYYGNEEKLFKAFRDFANKHPFYGCCIINGNDQKCVQIIQGMKKPYKSFGIEGQSKSDLFYSATNIQVVNRTTVYDLMVEGKKVIQITINLLGNHNVENSLAAIGVSLELGLSFEQVAYAIKKFHGVGRRFETIFETNDFVLIDDYGHHPTEVKATLGAAKKLKKNKVVLIFEPHRFSRTQICWDDFLHCFSDADTLYLLDIYPASESAIEGVNSSRLSQDINKLYPNFSKVLNTDNEIREVIEQNVSGNNVILSMGAGTIGKRIRLIVQSLKK
jgi:UDP-N-acetylmuramate--alanine ligase